MRSITQAFGLLTAYYRRRGLWPTLRKILGVAWRLRRRESAGQTATNPSLLLPDAQARFTDIFQRRGWGPMESASGYGSSVAYTGPLRAALPGLFARLGVRRLLDAPCGDFNWMRLVVESNDIEYLGGDIVEPLIAQNRARHQGLPRVSFMQLDITREPLPAADLMICRDCLFHLSYADALAFLRNFADSSIPWLLTTTHMNAGQFVNRDIETGDFRRIDLFQPPFSLPAAVIWRVEDWMPPEPMREMCVWSREQVAQALEGGGRA